MYIILIYDISLDDKKGTKVLNNVFKICKKYLHHIQNSVFEGEILESQVVKLKNELNKFIRKDKDSVILFKSRSKKWLDKEYVGLVEDYKTSNFL
ncbi:MAG: CRISPR-associated endonuclease Cas2 [Clostridia bacterium]